MSKQAAAMLFAPPQLPVRLIRTREFVIGRSSGCDLTISSEAASRRHAEVRFDRGHFVVRDLGSTNGTYLNGVRLEEAQRLEPGDRIEIGDSAVTFCQVEGGLDDAIATEGQTLLLTEPRGSETGEAFRGELAEIPAFAVLQVLEMGRKTGLLAVESADGAGRVWLVNGAPVHADFEKQSGFEAALALVRTERGRFAFDPGEQAPEQTIDVNVTELLLEASRLDDEEACQEA
jgi:pSer/pThr/pTyr-binding forkhead associated (FHA) protein